MRILISGSSGQIGTNLALRCLAEGHQVHGVDIRPNPWTTAISHSLVDLAQPTVAGLMIESGFPFGVPDVVVHLAGHAKVHQLMLKPDKALENITMTQQILEYCRQLDIPLIFASSREVYGVGHSGTVAEEAADFRQPISTYAAAKLSCETLVHAYNRGYGLRYLIFRLSNVYGRYDNDLQRMERVIPLFAEQLRQDEPITLFGPGKVLDFTYVDDCVDGLVRGIDSLATGRVVNETFNLARGEGRSLRELGELLANALGIAANMIEAPPRMGEIPRYVANLDKSRRLLGYNPQVSLPEGVCKALEWMAASKQYWDLSAFPGTDDNINRLHIAELVKPASNQ